MNRVVVSSLLLVASIASGSAQVPPQAATGPVHSLVARDLRLGQTVSSSRFGGRALGQAAWLSGDGRHALMYLFTKDTDGNGKIEALFGIHGEAMGDEPQLWLYDIEKDVGIPYDELLGIDPTSRWLGLVRSGKVVLRDLKTGTEEDVGASEALVDHDRNPCLPPRQLVMSPYEPSLALLARDPPVVVVRDLAVGGGSVVSPRAGYLWRAEFLHRPGWMILHTVPAPKRGEPPSFPVQRTSCACRSCGLFAMSMSFMGWDGPTVNTMLVAPDGRQVPLDPGVVLVDTVAFALPKSVEVYRLGGTRVAVPSSCTRLSVVPSAASVLLTCGARTLLFDPVSKREIDVPAAVALADGAAGVTTSTTEHWVAILAPERSIPEHGRVWEGRIGRMRLEDGTIELGPQITGADVRAQGAFLSGIRPEGAVMLNVRTGELWTVPGQGISWTDGRTAMFEDDEQRLMLVPELGLYARTDRASSASNEAGCWLQARGARFPVLQGPWRRMCLKEG